MNKAVASYLEARLRFPRATNKEVRELFLLGVTYELRLAMLDYVREGAPDRYQSGLGSVGYMRDFLRLMENADKGPLR